MIIEIKKQADAFVAFSPDVPTMPATSGETAGEACRQFCEANECEPTGYRFDMGAMLSFFPLNASAFGRQLGVNAALMRHYKAGSMVVSVARLETFEQALHDLGRQLCSVKLIKD